MAQKRSETNPLFVWLGGPLMVVCLYAAFNNLFPSPVPARIARLQKDLDALRQEAILPQQNLQLMATLNEKRETLDNTSNELDQLRRRVGEMMRGEIDGPQRLEIGGRVIRVLSGAGLQLIEERPVDDAGSNTSSKINSSLNAATSELGSTLTQMAANEASEITIEIPEDFPLEVNPVTWIAEQRALRVGTFDGPETRESLLKLVGDYPSMVAGLESIVDVCPDVVICTVGFEPPKVQFDGQQPLIWNIRLQMRPPMTNVETSGTTQQSVATAAQRQRSDGSSENASDGPIRQRYLVAKPAIRGDQ